MDFNLYSCLCESFKSWLRGRVGGEHRSIDISSIGWCPMENCPLLADTQYWYSVERRCCTEGRGEGLEIRPGSDWLRSDQLISRDWDSSSMTDHPEIERQLGMPPSLYFSFPSVWGLNLPYIDNIAVLLEVLINETFYGVSICCRVSNIFPTICYHYLWLVFDIPIIARIYPSLTSTSFLPFPVLFQWMGRAGELRAAQKMWHMRQRSE